MGIYVEQSQSNIPITILLVIVFMDTKLNRVTSMPQTFRGNIYHPLKTLQLNSSRKARHHKRHYNIEVYNVLILSMLQEGRDDIYKRHTFAFQRGKQRNFDYLEYQ